jgi:choline dehydrogenase-like flavoprotein
VTEHHDVVMAGTGAGGGTLANVLAKAGKRILLLERGNFLPRELANWGPGAGQGAGLAPLVPAPR